MVERKKQGLVLGLSMVQNGTHLGGWRHPQSPRGGSLDFRLWKQMAQTAEAAKIHFMFWADGVAVRLDETDPDKLSHNGRIDWFEPLTLLGALAAVTEHIGLIATASTTYNEPYALARKYASLDHLSNGRAGWNVVTSWSEQEALNFSRKKHLDHATRYRRAEEFFDVVTGLWDGWEDDAFIRDKESGRYFDPAKMHVLGHEGEFFQVKGPLNIARPPQGYPVIAEAGSSEPGQNLAARTADVVYTAQHDVEDARAFYSSQKGRLAAAGRRPEDMVVMPGAMVILGETDAEARDKLRALEALIHPKIGMGIIERVVGYTGPCDVDDRIPDPEHIHIEKQMSSNARRTLEHAHAQGMSWRQLYTRLSGGSSHTQFVGSAETVADIMQTWFEAGACDGFNLLMPYYPGGLDDVAKGLVPELQGRGLFQTEYRGTTLRENLGLERPRPGSRSCAATTEPAGALA